MMFVSLGIGVVVAVALIVTVSILTGGAVKNDNGQPTTELVGKTVQGFTLDGLNGGKVRAPWSYGHAGVVIFFASYCGPCHKEMPKVAAYLRAHHESPIVVLAVDADDSRSSGQAMIKKDDMTIPVASDPNGTITTGEFKFETVPETVFVSKKGVVEQVYFGAIPVDRLKAGLAQLRKA
jgi:peroxiredoxin